ncbi:MAG: TIGR01777 family oxidoreductase [Spirochaetia bacterium]|nr:TIGR01777 family oxidoreductase [Spirochaetia bacterium]
MNKKKLTLTIAGGSGVVGRHLIRHAQKQGWKIRVLTRKDIENSNDVIYYKWNTVENDKFDNNDDEIVKALEGSDFLINLAGTSIATGRLDKKMQNTVLMSRLNATNSLIEAYKKCKNPPKVWGQASAIGFYGDTKEEIIHENKNSGNLFLSEVCVQWENSARRILEINPSVKLIIARFGLVLAKDAPAWQEMIKPVRMGFGGAIGSGNQWFSWIDAYDLAEAFFYLFRQKDSGGVYNFTSPEPIRQKELSKITAKFYNKPNFMKIPKFLIRMIMGKTADELLLASCKALPQKLVHDGFKFTFKDIDHEIKHLLK